MVAVMSKWNGKCANHEMLIPVADTCECSVIIIDHLYSNIITNVSTLTSCSKHHWLEGSGCCFIPKNCWGGPRAVGPMSRHGTWWGSMTQHQGETEGWPMFHGFADEHGSHATEWEGRNLLSSSEATLPCRFTLIDTLHPLKKT